MGKIKRITIVSEYIEGYLWRIRIPISAETEAVHFSHLEIRNQIESSNKYYNQNKEEILKRESIKGETEEEKKKRKRWSRLYRLCHPNKDKIYRESNPDKYKIWDARHLSKRRELGFVPLNFPLDGVICAGHHINEEEVIYMPAFIHRRVSHNLETNKNMDLINSIAEGFR